MKKITNKTLALLIGFTPFVAFAFPDTPQGIKTWLEKIVGWISGIFFVVAAGFIIYAAFLYLTANGDEEKVSKAKSQLTYSVIAIAVALLAGSMRLIIEGFLNM